MVGKVVSHINPLASIVCEYNLFRWGGKIGVNVFVLISGYFLIIAPKIKISKVIKLWLQIAFYFMGFSLLNALARETINHLLCGWRQKVIRKNTFPLQ